MAKFDIKFFDEFWNHISIDCNVCEKNKNIIITTYQGDSFKRIKLDKSTAIKFAKTLRTEINKITESEVNNG